MRGSGRHDSSVKETEKMNKCWQWCMREEEVGEANLPRVY